MNPPSTSRFGGQPLGSTTSSLGSLRGDIPGGGAVGGRRDRITKDMKYNQQKVHFSSFSPWVAGIDVRID